jgi:hypothetical protein
MKISLDYVPIWLPSMLVPLRRIKSTWGESPIEISHSLTSKSGLNPKIYFFIFDLNVLDGE